MGKQDVMFAGGGEELDWTLSVLFDAMGAMSSNFNDTPAQGLARLRRGPRRLRHRRRRRRAGARRARARQGARRQDLCRGRRLRRDVRRLRHGGALGRRRGALHAHGAGDVKAPVDYINPHATSTPVGDIKEIEASARCSASKCPPISATKSLTGHSLGAAGVQEAIYSLLMMNNGFICESANIEQLDPGIRRHADRAQAQRQREARLRAVQLVRLRRHQRDAGVQASTMLEERVDAPDGATWANVSGMTN